MKQADACIHCLRRSWLLMLLGPRIESAAARSDRRDALELLGRDDEELLSIERPQRREAITRHLEGLDLDWFETLLADAGCWAVCRHRPDYPASLLDLDVPPAALFGRGDRTRFATVGTADAVAIVGAGGAATSYGRELSRTMAYEASAGGLTVISGMAFGIDACAHQGALDADGFNVAVLAADPSDPFPAAHRSLWGRITEVGAVVSELPPASTSWRWTFTARDRIIAALAGLTVLVEAPATPGVVGPTTFAGDLGRAVGAVPGPVKARLSSGPNRLLAAGATLVGDRADMVAALGSETPGEVPAYTVVGNFGESRSPFVEVVRTRGGVVQALARAREAFETQVGTGLDLWIDAVFDGSLQPLDLGETE